MGFNAVETNVVKHPQAFMEKWSMEKQLAWRPSPIWKWMESEGWTQVTCKKKKLSNRLSLRELQHTPVSHTPGIPFQPQMLQEFRNINCWLGVWGMFQGYVGKFLDYRYPLSSPPRMVHQVGGWRNHPFEKNMRPSNWVKIFPKIPGENIWVASTKYICLYVYCSINWWRISSSIIFT